jgi:D-glycero-D-manno-heptose 1,7-bisphosphate phosphatase
MRQAVLLVGGRGTRLGDLARSTPKPLLPIVGSKLFLDYLIENIARSGVEEVLLLAGHLAEQVERRYDGEAIRGARVSVIREPEPAGTAGALIYARERLDDVFLMSNGDSILDMNFLALAEKMRSGVEGTLALRNVDDVRRYARVDLNGDHIIGFREKDETAIAPGLISGGVYMLRKSILDQIKSLPCSIEIDIFPKLAAEGRLIGVPVSGYFLDIGLPETLGEARRDMPDALRRRAVFFDRDGTLNVDTGYTHEVEALELLPGAVEAVRAVNDAGALAIVVTNQSGLARGLFTEAELSAFHQALQSRFAEGGAHIDAFYHSPFHGEGSVADLARKDHPDRKPAPGMLRRAILDWDIESAGSAMLGDTDTDVAAAAAAGVRGAKVSPGGLFEATKTALAASATQFSLNSARRLLKDRAGIARAWLFDEALPLWWKVGFDQSSSTFHERIDQTGRPVQLPRRIRVQARQTFVYALAGELGWKGAWREAAEAGANALLKLGIREDGGTRYSLTPSGQDIAEGNRDLYDAAFVAFALASAAKALGRADYAAAGSEIVDWTVANWSHPAGGFYEGDIAPVPPRRQNPHMHMLEALLQLFVATGDRAFLEKAGKLVALLETKWISPRWGALLEYFTDDWTPRPGDEGRIAEPGHQFEWSWLLDRYARLSGARISPAANRIYLHGEVYGVNPATGVTVDETWAEGGVRTSTSRLWPHTERIKANVVRFEQTGSISAALCCAQAFDVLMTYCDVPVRGLWRDRRLPDGSFIDEAAPASSFYHIALAFSELIRVAAQA